MIDAVLATEDARFYEHPGIDPIGIIRAATVWAVSGQARQAPVPLPSRWPATSS